MSSEQHERIVFLNHLVSRSKARTSHRDKAPTLSGYELLKIIQSRLNEDVAIEFFGSLDDKDDEIRIDNGSGHDFIRIKEMRFTKKGDFRYAYLLFEYGDQRVKSLPVVHTRSFAGRELEGDLEEVGASCAHVLVRMPGDQAYDDGRYRCAIEHVNGGVSRRYVELFFRRQLRRYAESVSLSFTVVDTKRGRKPKEIEYRYHPSLELMADVGRKLADFSGTKKILTQLVFTKRSEKLSAGQPTDVSHADYTADLEVKISALQGPDDPKEKLSWVTKIRDRYESTGYQTQLSYRYVGGATLKGTASGEVAGAADLLMCPKEIVYLDEPPKRWRDALCPLIGQKLSQLVDRDELWERAK